MAAVVAMIEFRKEIENSSVVLFNDNNTTLISLLKGCSKNLEANKLAWTFWKLAGIANCTIWMERVNSAANPADTLSRQVTTIGHSEVFQQIRDAKCEILLWKEYGSFFVSNLAVWPLTFATLKVETQPLQFPKKCRLRVMRGFRTQKLRGQLIRATQFGASICVINCSRSFKKFININDLPGGDHSPVIFHWKLRGEVVQS